MSHHRTIFVTMHDFALGHCIVDTRDARRVSGYSPDREKLEREADEKNAARFDRVKLGLEEE
tara:strand:- start:24696 stop:24881 length:186 start_codon:yes stop_codon:yes gene_type:complete